MPLIKHQKISSKIDRYLNESFENCNECQVLLPVDWKIDENTIVQPDNLVICHEPANEAYLSIVPKIIFEIVLKSTASKDTGIKFDLYEKEGVEYYIIVNPEDEIAKVYRLKEGTYLKVCDTKDDTVTFSLDECEMKFDFSLIWQSFYYAE